MGWMSNFIKSQNVSAVRVVRILRPLRTINSLAGMKQLVQGLLSSLPQLFDILILFLFLMVIQGTVATQLFGGFLRKRCHYDNGSPVFIDGDKIICRFDG